MELDVKQSAHQADEDLVLENIHNMVVSHYDGWKQNDESPMAMLEMCLLWPPPSLDNHGSCCRDNCRIPVGRELWRYVLLRLLAAAPFPPCNKIADHDCLPCRLAHDVGHRDDARRIDHY